MKEELDQSDVLNGFRFDVLDARDVQEVVFVVRDKIALHLRRVHAAVRLRDVDHRQVEVRKDVHRHPRQRENRAERDADDHDKNREWPDERSIDNPHSYGFPLIGVFVTCSRKGVTSPCARAAINRARQTASRATASSASACASSRCASATSMTLASPFSYLTRARSSVSCAALS